MIRTAIVTVSDSVFAGTREDKSGAVLEARIVELGWTLVARHVVPDETAKISSLLSEFVHGAAADVIVTTGGTGLALRDVTPEATRVISNREIPGFGEAMRAAGLQSTKYSPLSRSTAFTAATTLILNLPGSPRGALESFDAVAALIPHAVDLLHGRTEHQ